MFEFILFDENFKEFVKVLEDKEEDKKEEEKDDKGQRGVKSY